MSSRADTSPFKRRPALSRTYGSSSRRSSNPPSRTAEVGSGVKGLLDDLSSDEEVLVQLTGRAKGREGDEEGEGEVGKEREGGSVGSAARQSVLKGGNEAGTAQAKRPQAVRRTRSSLAQPLEEEEDQQLVKEATVWDEQEVAKTRPSVAGTKRRSSRRTNGTSVSAPPPAESSIATAKSPSKQPARPPTPSRRSSSRLSTSIPATTAAAADDGPASPPPRKRSRTSAPSRMQPTSKGKEKEEDADDIPEPFDYVPLAERLKKEAGTEKKVRKAPAAAASSSAKTQRPPLRTTRSGRVVKTEDDTTVADAPAPSPVPKVSAPSPARPPARSRTPSAPSVSRPTKTAPKSTPPPRPASPAKDLSALFSRFAPPPASTAAERGESPQRMGLKRTLSLGGVVRSLKAGVKRVAVEDVLEEEVAGAGGSVPPSPSRTTLDRSYSQPNLPSSPLGSPVRSPSRPPLSASQSFPHFGSPSAREASPSPLSRPASPARPNSSKSNNIFGPGPALGSAYRPVSSAPPAAAAFGLLGSAPGGGGAAPTRTYAGGARSFRKDTAEEDLLSPPSKSNLSRLATGASASSSSPSSSAVAGLPPSLSRRNPRGPPPQRETYASLRVLWGIDAEETLEDEESHDSQDRGAKVVGTGLLRKQGEGKRWMDELGWVMEGLREGGEGDKGAARASALDLLQKALDRDWLRRLKSSGQAESVYLAFRLSSAGSSTSDRVLDVAFAILLALLVRDQRMVEPLFRLSPTDIEREKQKRGRESQESMSQGPSLKRSVSMSAASERRTLTAEGSFVSSSSYSSSPRKAEAETDERSDLLEVLRELSEKDWACEEIGSAQVGGMDGSLGKKAKVLKGDARHLQSLRDVLDSSAILSESSLPPTMQSLVLLTIRSISFFSPRTIFQPQHMMCVSGVFERVARVFLEESQALSARLSKYEQGFDLLPPPDAAASPISFSLPTLALGLSIFEATSLAAPLAFHIISTDDFLSPLAEAFRHLILVSFLLAFDSSTAASSLSSKRLATNTLSAVLGILFGLTTEPSWASALVGENGEVLVTLVRIALACRRSAADLGRTEASAQTDVKRLAPPKPEANDSSDPPSSGVSSSGVSAAESATKDRIAVESQLVWDIFSLSLGVLANLAESADGVVKEALRTLVLNPSCQGKRRCAQRCQCAETSQQSLLEILSHLALDPLEDAPNTVHQTSVTGFLRLLLGLAILDDPHNETVLLDTIGTSKATLVGILDALDELAKLHDEQNEVRGLLEGPEEMQEDEAGESQRTEVVEETQVEEDEQMEVLPAQSGEASKRMRELVERLRRRTR
ncbi:hypothetical protein RTBOTA2_003836 [Rhodotorula toruloides]|nr:hypothetical protein RTBOTA2_003836 [Rhodotorula toruloides]